MRLTITRRQHNDTMFAYNERTYETTNDDIILDFLNEYDGEGNIREWVEENLRYMNTLHNQMSLGYDDKECDKVDYSIVFDNDITKTSFKC